MTEQTIEYVVSSPNGPVKVQQCTTRLSAYKKVIEGALLMCTGIYELVTGDKAPKYKDVLNQR